jgi:hypothetical protein
MAYLQNVFHNRITKVVLSQANSRGFRLDAMVHREDHNTVKGLGFRKAENLTG